MRNLSLALVLTAIAAGTAAADTRLPEARSLDLGAVRGVAYYTEEPDGYRVVATLAAGEASSPMRFTATLAEGQAFTISAPGTAETPETAVEIRRSGETLSVSSAPVATD